MYDSVAMGCFIVMSAMREGWSTTECTGHAHLEAQQRILKHNLCGCIYTPLPRESTILLFF
jgi:hypothetical protein